MTDEARMIETMFCLALMANLSVDQIHAVTTTYLKLRDGELEMPEFAK